MKEEPGKQEVEAQAGITPTPHTMFFHRSGQPLEAASPQESLYRAALEAQHAKAPGARPLPQNLGLQHSAELEAKAAQAAAVRQEAQAVKAAEATARHHQATVEQQLQHTQAGERSDTVEEMLQKEKTLKDELERKYAEMSQRHHIYCQREVATQARMVERDTKIQENSEYQQKVQEETNRLTAVLMLRENPEERNLLAEFTAFDQRLSEKHQEFMSLQQEDVEKQRKYAEKKGILQENEANLAKLRVKNQSTLQSIEAHMRQQLPDPRFANSKRLLSQLMAAEKADSEASAVRKEQKARRIQENEETRQMEKQKMLAAEASAMHEQQQRQQRLQDESIQAEQQAQAEAYAIAQQQEQAEQQAAMAEVETKAVAEQEEQRQQLLQEEQQRQQEWQNYLLAKMADGKKREEAMFAEHKEEQDRLKAELAAEEQRYIASMRERHQQHLEELEQRSEQQQQELFQQEQQKQLQLQQKLEATKTGQLLPPVEFSDDESLTPVAKKPRPYVQLRGELPRYVPPVSKAQAPFPVSLPQAKAPGAYQSQTPTSSQIPAAFASQTEQTPAATQVAFTPGRLEGGSGLFLLSPAQPGLRKPVVVPPRPAAFGAAPPSAKSPPTPAPQLQQQQPVQGTATTAPSEQPTVASAAPETRVYLGWNLSFFFASNLDFTNRLLDKKYQRITLRWMILSFKSRIRVSFETGILDFRINLNLEYMFLLKQVFKIFSSKCKPIEYMFHLKHVF